MGTYTNKELGNIGENIALKTYINAGYTLLASNWRFAQLGEIDLILTKNDLIVFCEVKTRSANSFESPSHAVNKQKQRRIIRLSKIFINQNFLYKHYNVRYDVCQIIKQNNNKFLVEVLSNAFISWKNWIVQKKLG